MPAAVRKNAAPLILVWGEDDFAVQQRARQLYREWCQAAGGFDQETIDASVSNSGEALRATDRLREALQSLPFFGSQKVVWFQNCNFLGDERTASSATVTARLGELAQELKAFRWEGVRLLITAGKVDKRRTFYRTIESTGQVEEYPGLSFEDKGWADRAERFVREELAARSKRMSPDAVERLVAAVGPDLRQLSQEVEKLALYAGDRSDLLIDDVARMVTPGKHAKSFGLAEALGDRNLPRALRALDDELWEIRLKVDRSKSHIGLLYGLISKIRTLILLKELVRMGLLAADAESGRVKSQLTQLPADLLPSDRRYNPAAMHPFVVSKSLAQTGNYTAPELVGAMEILLACNERLVSSSLEEDLVLQHALIRIIGPARERRS